MDITICIPYYNGAAHIGRLLASIPDRIPVLIVDDQSDGPLPEMRRPNTRIVRLVEKGYFAGAVNAALANTQGDVLILNQDTWLEGDGWLHLIEEKRGAYGLIGEAVAAHLAWPKGYIHGTFMYFRRDVIQAVGLLDGKHYPLWGGTCEYQARACRHGFKALPLTQGTIPGFHHSRQGHYGDGISELLKREPSKRGLLIRTPPLVSVVINCYNQGRFLDDAINSLIGGETSLGHQPGQSFQGFEIVIVDDGSTDNTAAIADTLADAWKGIHVIHQRNAGSAAAMNAGIGAARGKFIAPLDSDDMMKPTRLERMIAILEANPHSVIYDDPAYFAFGQYGITTDRRSSKLVYSMPLPKVYDFERTLHKNGMHKGLLFERKAWEEVGGYPEIMNKGREDWAFNVALGIRGYCGLHTGAAEYLYRREGHNRTLVNTTPEWQNKFREQLKRLYPDIYRGERPTMCCGNRRVTSGAAPRGGGRGAGSAPVGARGLDPLPGASGGMVKLEYQGSNAGDETWTDAYKGTGRVYVFGGARKIGYVEKKDADWMLQVRANGKNIFRVYAPPAQPAPRVFVAPQVIITKIIAPPVQAVAPKPALQAETTQPLTQEEPPHEEDFGEAPAPETPAPQAVIVDLLGLSVRDLKAMLEENSYPRAILEATLAQEKRMSARKLLEAALG